MTRYRVTEVLEPLIYQPWRQTEQEFRTVQVIERWYWYWPFWVVHTKLWTSFENAIEYASLLQGRRRHYANAKFDPNLVSKPASVPNKAHKT